MDKIPPEILGGVGAGVAVLLVLLILYRYLLREVGPITDNLAKIYLDEVRKSYGDVLRGLDFDGEGCLPADKLAAQAQELPERSEARLVETLNELLYALLLAVRKTLGAEHEQKVMRVLKDIRGDAFATQSGGL